MYETVEDITTQQPNFKLRNIGWAQFRNITDNYILYENPKYKTFISTIIGQKLEISLFNMYLFYLSKLEVIEEIIAAANVPPRCRLRSLYHFCWMYDVLVQNSIDREFILPVKHIMDIPVTETVLNEIFKKINYVHNYFSLHPPCKPNIMLGETDEQ